MELVRSAWRQRSSVRAPCFWPWAAARRRAVFVGQVGTFGVLDVDGAEGVRGLFLGQRGEADVDDLGFDARVPAFEPESADEVVEETLFFGALGAVLVLEFASELIELGRVFAGKNVGMRVEAELEGVAGRDRFACWRSRAG